MKIKIHSKLFIPTIILGITFSSCCQIFDNCAETNEESVLNDSNTKVRLIVISNNSCKNCTGEGNYAIENYLENKTSQKITVTYSHNTMIRQPGGNTISTPETSSIDIESNQRIAIACSCKTLSAVGDTMTLDIKIISAN